jgi:hypothetical protein
MKTNRLLNAIISIGLLTAANGSQAQDRATPITTNDGTQGTLTSGQPAPDHYGPAPSFTQLDINHDGFVSRDEAGAYPPLLNDFDFIAHHANRISKRQFDYWNRTQNR